jgi:hypothetical protein
MSSLKRPGPPPLVIPDWVIEELEATYENQELGILEDVEPGPDTTEFIKVGKLYAKRNEKSFRYNWDGNNLLFQLTDKRPYRKSTLPREK